jgi:hypothetical protein
MSDNNMPSSIKDESSQYFFKRVFFIAFTSPALPHPSGMGSMHLRTPHRGRRFLSVETY